MKITKWIITGLAGFVLAGCAGMSQEECMNADWRMIGMEDGARGLLESAIGEHRRDCADHGVTPDLDAYRTGRDQGLLEYCVPLSAFNLGVSGASYNGVCPNSREESFMAAYRDGLQIHAAQSEVRRIAGVLNRKQQQLSSAQSALQIQENVLLQPAAGEATRRAALEEVRALEAEIRNIEVDIVGVESHLREAEGEVERLNQQFTY